MAIQPIEFIHVNKIPFIEGNAIKYICRHHKKNGRQDIEKSIHYLELLLQLEYGNTDLKSEENQSFKKIEDYNDLDAFMEDSINAEVDKMVEMHRSIEGRRFFIPLLRKTGTWVKAPDRGSDGFDVFVLLTWKDNDDLTIWHDYKNVVLYNPEIHTNLL